MSDENELELGQKIKARRKAKGWSQADLAHRTGSSVRTVGRWENKGLLPKPDTVRALKRELDLTEADFRKAFGERLAAPPKKSERYEVCSFATAKEKFGSYEALDEARGEIEDEWPVPELPGEYGTDEKWLELLQLSPESGGVVMHHDGEIVGYWECLAVLDDTYDAILRGENVNKEISPDNIVILMFSGTYKLYFVDLFLRKTHTNIATRKLLIKDFLTFLREAAEEGIFFDRIAANITGVEVKYQCRKLGFRKVTDHQVHRYYNGTKTEDGQKVAVPAEIYELVIGPKAKRLFSHDPKLMDLYVAQGNFDFGT